MTQKSFDDLFSKGKHDANQLSVFWHTEEHLKFHKELFEEKITADFLQGKADYLFLRKDLRAPYGDYIVIGARLVTNYEGYTREEQSEDINAVKKIINSVTAYR